MALLATTFTVEIILLLIGLYFIDRGLLSKIGSIGLFVLGLQLSYGKQVYVSDATTSPSNTFLIFTPEIQRVFVIMFAILTLLTAALFFVNVAKIWKFVSNGGKMTYADLYEELV